MNNDYSIRQLCQLLQMSPSTYYYNEKRIVEKELVEKLKELAGQWPTYGARRLSQELKRADFAVGRVKTATLMQQLGLQARRKRRKKRTTQSDHHFQRYPNLVLGLEVTYPEQLWVADITYIRLGNVFVFLAIVMDVFTRQIRGWHLSRTIDHLLTTAALKKALRWGKPDIHHSDQGVQYATPEYTNLLEDIQVSMSEVGQAWQNGYAERVIRTIKEDEVDLSEYANFEDALAQIGNFIDTVYAHKRIHSALGYLTPAEFEAKWLSQISAEK